jgi:ubiquinone/menaquinone biosynthesis C-methylase UbiE
VEPHDHVFDAADGSRLVAQGERALPLLEAVALRADEHALDIGCGPGVAVEVASRALAHGRIVGIDPSDAMLDDARRRTHGADNVVLERATVDAIPLEDDSVDVAWALNSLHHWPDRVAGLVEVRRVLRPGGRFLVVEQEPHQHRALDAAHTAAVVDLLTAAGFDVFEVGGYEAAGEMHTLLRTALPAPG